PHKIRTPPGAAPRRRPARNLRNALWVFGPFRENAARPTADSFAAQRRLEYNIHAFRQADAGGLDVDVWKEFEQNVITHSAAHHLMAIDDLVRRTGYARVSDVARQLNITRGSVSMSLKPLKEAGLIVQDENKHLRLSEAGQALIDGIKTKRLLVTRLFADLLGVDRLQAEIDACKLEHLISDETASRLLSFLRFIESDPQRTRAFIEAWKKFDPSCGHEPERCPSCSIGCMAETVTPTSTRSEEDS
ncbi:MAG: metal-dependent transcriptional regulator, partial [Planctomycetota bacterium]